VAAPSWIPNPN